jgi:hypothetical protein
LILLGAAAVWCLCAPRVRAHLPSLLRAIFAWRLTVLWGVYIAYCVAVVLVARQFGVWQLPMLWPTLVVGATAGLPLVADAISARAGSPGHHVKRRVFAASAFAGLYVNLVSFPLLVELVLQIVATLATMLLIYARSDPRYAPVARLMSWVLGMISVLLLWRTTSHLLAGMGSQEWRDLAATVALSLWFPLSLLPLLYLVGYATAVESAATRTVVLGRARRRSRCVWWLVLLFALRGRLSLARGFDGHWSQRLGNAQDRRERRLVLAEYRRNRRRKRAPDEATAAA